MKSKVIPRLEVEKKTLFYMIFLTSNIVFFASVEFVVCGGVLSLDGTSDHISSSDVHGGQGKKEDSSSLGFNVPHKVFLKNNINV